MKMLKINFKALALVLAIGAAFAFNEREANPVWYRLDPNGDVIETQLSGPPEDCNDGSIFCAVEMDADEFTGNPPIDNVNDSDPNNYIKDVLYKH